MCSGRDAGQDGNGFRTMSTTCRDELDGRNRPLARTQPGRGRRPGPSAGSVARAQAVPGAHRGSGSGYRDGRTGVRKWPRSPRRRAVSRWPGRPGRHSAPNRTGPATGEHGDLHVGNGTILGGSATCRMPPVLPASVGREPSERIFHERRPRTCSLSWRPRPGQGRRARRLPDPGFSRWLRLSPALSPGTPFKLSDTTFRYFRHVSATRARAAGAPERPDRRSARPGGPGALLAKDPDIQRLPDNPRREVERRLPSVICGARRTIRRTSPPGRRAGAGFPRRRLAQLRPLPRAPAGGRGTNPVDYCDICAMAPQPRSWYSLEEVGFGAVGSRKHRRRSRSIPLVVRRRPGRRWAAAGGVRVVIGPRRESWWPSRHRYHRWRNRPVGRW